MSRFLDCKSLDHGGRFAKDVKRLPCGDFIDFLNGESGVNDHPIPHTGIFQKKQARFAAYTVYIDGRHVIFNFDNPGWYRQTHGDILLPCDDK